MRLDRLQSGPKPQSNESQQSARMSDLFTQVAPDKLPSAVLNFNADTFFHPIFWVLTKKALGKNR